MVTKWSTSVKDNHRLPHTATDWLKCSLLNDKVEVEKDSLYDFLAIGEKLKLKGLAKTPEHSASQVIISFSLFVHVASNYHPHHLSKA